MALSHSTGLSNAATDGGFGPAFDGAAGTVKLAVFSGTFPSAVTVGGKSAPANAVIQDGTHIKLWEVSLNAADVFGAAANGGVTSLNGVPFSAAAIATGTSAYFCIYRTGDTALTSAAAATDRRLIGTVGTSGADMTVDNTSLNQNQNEQINGWSWTHPV